MALRGDKNVGLDMYALVTDEKPEKPVDFDIDNLEYSECFYWRKHPNLHGWMCNLYYEKGGSSDEFNCVPVEISLNDLDRLEAAVKSHSLPLTTGFFFGITRPFELERDLEFIDLARRHIEEGRYIFYDSWW